MNWQGITQRLQRGIERQQRRDMLMPNTTWECVIVLVKASINHSQRHSSGIVRLQHKEMLWLSIISEFVTQTVMEYPNQIQRLSIGGGNLANMVI